MKQSKLKKFCIDVAMGSTQNFDAQTLIAEAEKIYDYVSGIVNNQMISQQGCVDPYAKLPDKEAYEYFEKAFMQMVTGGTIKEKDITPHYRNYMNDPHIYDSSHFIERSMRHLSSISGGLYLKPLIVDPLVKETYTATIHNPNLGGESMTSGIVLSIKASQVDTEIAIEKDELRRMLEAVYEYDNGSSLADLI